MTPMRPQGPFRGRASSAGADGAAAPLRWIVAGRIAMLANLSQREKGAFPRVIGAIFSRLLRAAFFPRAVPFTHGCKSPGATAYLPLNAFPLPRLHFMHLHCRLSSTVSPPLSQGMMWSTWSSTPRVLRGLAPQDWHENPSRTKMRNRWRSVISRRVCRLGFTCVWTFGWLVSSPCSPPDDGTAVSSRLTQSTKACSAFVQEPNLFL